MNDFLPSRRYGLFLVLTIAIVGGILWMSGGKRDESQVAVSATASTTLLANSARATSTPTFTLAAPAPEPTLSERVLGEEDARKGLSLKDLKIANGESDEILHTYGLAVRDALAALGTAAQEDELSVFLNSLKTANVEKVPLLQAAAQRHDNAVLFLTQVQVPGSAAPMHLRLIRTLGHRSQLLRVMAQIEDKPIDAMSAADQYIAETDNVLANMAEVNQYFLDKGITFSKRERGTVSITKYE